MRFQIPRNLFVICVRSRNRKKGLEPELRVIDIETKEEISADTLSVNRFEGMRE
jgi:hypothetical protein